MFFRNRAKKGSFTYLSLICLLLKTIFDCISRIFLFSAWLYVINEGQFSSTKTVVAFYFTFLVLIAFNILLNNRQKYFSTRNLIGIYRHKNIWIILKVFSFRDSSELFEFCVIIQQLWFWSSVFENQEKPFQGCDCSTWTNLL